MNDEKKFANKSDDNIINDDNRDNSRLNQDDTLKDLKDSLQHTLLDTSEIFNSASSMLGHAITAKTAKINKKLKMLDLQMKKAQLDAKNAAKTEEIENTPLGAGQSLDRNELLKMFNTKNNEQ